ncbi:MAG TPA: ACP phosphodiesterase [Taishania sp.]|nr:ACP phosphodiesterase [Taishania sp.]
MNYLGHLYFSNNDLDLMHANLLGDFVKGKDLSAFSPTQQKGIILHRKIDDFMAKHSAVKVISKTLSPSLPKVAPIALDVYFDHFLALHWMRYHTQQLDDFLAAFYAHPLQSNEYTNQQFQTLIQNMKTHQWMNQYANLYAVDRACSFLATKLSFANQLGQGRTVLEQNYTEVEQAFFAYMLDAKVYFEQEGWE